MQSGIAQSKSLVSYVEKMTGELMPFLSTNRYGGSLRCYLGADPQDEDGDSCKSPQDIHPIGGRLVLFKSREMLHEVRPVHGNRTRRYALSIWILGRQQDVGRQRHQQQQ